MAEKIYHMICGAVILILMLLVALWGDAQARKIIAKDCANYGKFEVNSEWFECNKVAK